MSTSEEALRRLTIGDPGYCRAVMAAELEYSPHGLDARSVALLRLGGSMTAGSVGPIWQQRVGDALDAGLGFDEIVGSLLALAPSIGLDRVVAIAPELARALGYDVDAALERLDDPSPATGWGYRSRAKHAGACGSPDLSSNFERERGSWRIGQ